MFQPLKYLYYTYFFFTLRSNSIIKSIIPAYYTFQNLGLYWINILDTNFPRRSRSPIPGSSVILGSRRVIRK